MITLDDLNPSQRKAEAWNDGPVLVLAGPGSGKTSVLTLRAARLLERDPNASALALTFTTLAAAEMRERVRRMLGTLDNRARLCTFHRFATGLLGQHGSHVGISPDFRHLTRDQDRLTMVENAIKGLPEWAGRVSSDRRSVLKMIDRLFAEGDVGHGDAASLADTPDWLPPLFRRYCEAMVSANALDFGSLLHFATRLLHDSSPVARVTRMSWKYVCVDEFQDTNQAQYNLLRALCPRSDSNLFVVGDDDQIIYQWNGATPKRFADLKEDYDLATIQLPESYRCPPPIVERANSLIARNRQRMEKEPLRWSDPAASGAGAGTVRERPGHYSGAVRLEVLPSPKQEAEFVARDMRERGLAASDCVVLGRSVRLVEQAVAILSAAGHEACFLKRKSDFDSPVVNVVVEALRLADFPHDRSALGRLCAAWEELTGGVVDADAAEAEAALAGGSFLRGWTRVAAAAASDKHTRLVRAISDDLVDRMAFLDVVNCCLDGGWRTWDGDGPDSATEKEVATWRALHREIVADSGPAVTLREYVRQLDTASKTVPPGPRALRCMTVHGSKGLGCPHVYLIGMAQEVYPTFHALRRGQDSRAMEEERRSCFVAVTRASETLTLTRSETYYGYPKAPSQFLDEMGLT